MFGINWLISGIYKADAEKGYRRKLYSAADR